MKQRSWWFQVVLALILGTTGFSCLAAGQGSDVTNDRGVITVDVLQAKRLFDLGVIFIDLRSEEKWRLGHIKNAMHIDFQYDFTDFENLNGIDLGTPIVFYCDSSECLRGAYASTITAYMGYQNVFYFRQGYFAWLLQDFPAEMNLIARRLDD